MVGPIPFTKHAYKYGATTARKEALCKGMDASERQANMNKTHAGGSKIVIPQIYTGSSSDGELNKHIVETNKALMTHDENRKFDKLALSNKVGGRKKRTRKTKKTKRTKRSNKKNRTKKLK